MVFYIRRFGVLPEAARHKSDIQDVIYADFCAGSYSYDIPLVAVHRSLAAEAIFAAARQKTAVTRFSCQPQFLLD